MRWYAASTALHREFFAAEQLAAQEFRVFLPAMRRMVRHARKVSEVRRAFFPGYLFVSLEPGRQPWRSVNSTRGVRRLVGSAERPAPVPPGFVEEMMARTDSDGLLSLADRLAVGDRVRIAQGPFAEFVGVVSQLPEDDRVRVLLDVMAGGAPVNLPRSHCLRVA